MEAERLLRDHRCGFEPPGPSGKSRSEKLSGSTQDQKKKKTQKNTLTTWNLEFAPVGSRARSLEPFSEGWNSGGDAGMDHQPMVNFGSQFKERTGAPSPASPPFPANASHCSETSSHRSE